MLSPVAISVFTVPRKWLELLENRTALNYSWIINIVSIAALLEIQFVPKEHAVQ